MTISTEPSFALEDAAQEGFMKRVRRSLFKSLVSGSRFTCPFCEHSFNRFLAGGSKAALPKKLKAVGIGRRANARCPHCGSNDRGRLLLLYLRTTELFSDPNIRVLDIAPDLHLAHTLRTQLGDRYVVGALFPEEFAEVDAIQADVTQIPFDDRSFDVVLCNHVLQQVPDDRKAMRELARVLKPGGWGLLQVPIAQGLEFTLEDPEVKAPRERRKAFGSTLHERLYGRDYTARLETEGFAVTKTHPKLDGWCPDAERYATIADEELFVVYR